jgi:mannose-6-phosphate isomerase
MTRETRPWGYYEILYTENGMQIKRLVVHSGKRLSLQSHEKRSEHWYIKEGQALAEIEGNTYTLDVGHSITILKGEKHRVSAAGNDDLELIEIQEGTYRSLGTAIDTTMATMVPKTVVDAKGDIIAATAADTVDRLAVGANDTVLTADSSTATGLKWATPASGGMTLISTTTLSGSSVTLSSIPTTYKNLQLIVRNYKPSLDGYGFQVRVNADSGANRHYSAYTFQAINQSFNATLWIIGGPDNVEDNGLMVLNFWDYTNTTTWKIASSFSIRNHETNGTNLTMEPSHHAYNQTTAITSLVLSVISGTFTGTALLYGVS